MCFVHAETCSSYWIPVSSNQSFFDRRPKLQRPFLCGNPRRSAVSERLKSALLASASEGIIIFLHSDAWCKDEHKLLVWICLILYTVPPPAHNRLHNYMNVYKHSLVSKRCLVFTSTDYFSVTITQNITICSLLWSFRKLFYPHLS